MRKIMEEGSCDGYLLNDSLMTIKNLYSKDRFEIVTNLDELSFLNGIYSREELIDELDSLKEYVSPHIVKDNMKIFLNEIEALRKNLEELDYPVEINPLMSSVKDPDRRREIFYTLMSMLKSKNISVKRLATNDDLFKKHIFSATQYPSIYSTAVGDIDVYRENIDGESYFRIKREFSDPIIGKPAVPNREVLFNVDNCTVESIRNVSNILGYKKEHPIISVIYYLAELEKGKFFNIVDTLSPLFLGKDIKVNTVSYMIDNHDVDGDPYSVDGTASLEVTVEGSKESLLFTRLYSTEESVGYTIAEQNIGGTNTILTRDLKGYLLYYLLTREIFLEDETLDRIINTINIITHGKEDVEFKEMESVPDYAIEDISLSGLKLYLNQYINLLYDVFSTTGNDPDTLKIITFPFVSDEGFNYRIQHYNCFAGIVMYSPSFFNKYEEFEDSYIWNLIDSNAKALIKKIIKVKQDIEAKKESESKEEK
nr:MAG TPA: hypothetical protein [Caudoviricetes sp.]